MTRDGVAAGSLSTIIEAVADPAYRTDLADQLRSWDSYEWRRLLLDLPVDAATFAGRFECSWDRFIADLNRWWRDFHGQPAQVQQRYAAVAGYLGLLLVTLVSLRHTDTQRHPVSPAAGPATTMDARPTHDCAAICAAAFQAATVRAALRSVYEPEAWVPEQLAGTDPLDQAGVDEWQNIDFDTLRFHRHGTTSFILEGRPRVPVQGYRRPLALKCILYPYLRIPTIIRATREYMSRYGVPSREVAHVARVWASSHNWIIMDFVAGQTLREYVRRRLAAAPAAGPEIRLDVFADCGRRLFDAMADLERADLRHGDLSPSNIIVQDGDLGGRFVLIDFGVNYLYTHTMPGLEGPDATFVAPEVRMGQDGGDQADLYSIGRLLILFAGGTHAAGGPVPDSFYAETPVMARFVEDLVDGRPDNRLLLFTPDPTRPTYPQLRVSFEEELAAMTAARAGGQPASRFLQGVAELVRPLAGAPRRQLRLWRLRRTQQLYRDPRRGMHVRWLLFWSWVSASVWYIGAVVVITWWLRDLELDWGNQLLALLQRLTGTSPDEFPYLDALRAPDYLIPDHAENWPVRVVGLSFLLVGARYYQNLFAGLTPLVAGLRQGSLSLWAVAAEVHMRAQTVVAFLLVMPPTLVQQRWWPIATAIGVLISFLTNWVCLSFARAAFRHAARHGLSIDQHQSANALKSFSDWTPSSGFYAAACWVIGVLIYIGVATDVFMYACAVGAINVVLFYTIKCSGQSAADVRAGLGRAVVAAERSRYVTAGREPGGTRRPDRVAAAAGNPGCA